MEESDHTVLQCRKSQTDPHPAPGISKSSLKLIYQMLLLDTLGLAILQLQTLLSSAIILLFPCVRLKRNKQAKAKFHTALSGPKAKGC